MRDQVSAGKCVAVEQMGDYRLNGLYSRARRAHTFWFHAGSGLALRHVMHETKIDCEGKRMAEKAGSARDGGMEGWVGRRNGRRGWGFVAESRLAGRGRSGHIVETAESDGGVG